MFHPHCIKQSSSIVSLAISCLKRVKATKYKEITFFLNAQRNVSATDNLRLSVWNATGLHPFKKPIVTVHTGRRVDVRHVCFVQYLFLLLKAFL